MSLELTSEQKAAIGARGKVIVSASAGSGKTFVMIRRLVSLIVGGVNVRDVLAVTYTNKAAAQMREKLRSALVKAVGESRDPAERARLKEQLAALPLADICTMHVFCARLIRTYFYLDDVDPAFRIVGTDDAECKTIAARALDETLDEAYRQGSEEFKLLLSYYYRKKSDLLLRSTIRAMDAKVCSVGDPEQRLAEAGNVPFERIASAILQGYRRKIASLYAGLEELAPSFEGNKPGERLCSVLAQEMRPFLTEERFGEAVRLAQEVGKIPSAPPKTKAAGEELARILRLSAISASFKEVVKALSGIDPEAERIRHEEASVRTRALAALVLDYRERFRRLKREAGFLDYDDLEQGALRVLRDEEVREAVRRRYRYVFVDEYQDVNLVQEELLGLVGGEEVFLVGDAKQAIYAFRGSRSRYFLQKTRSFPVSLRLSESFRSAPAVIEAVNEVFSHAMTEETCGLDYAAEAVMQGGRRYGEHRGEVRCILLPEREKGEAEERGVYSVLSALRDEEQDPLAESITALVQRELGRPWFDADEQRERPVTYGDIAILTRTRSGAAERIVRGLSEVGIPVTATAEVNVCDFWEAKLVLGWLSYLDNAEQDIPMAGAMLSFLGGFTERDLAAVRSRFALAPSFRAACRSYAEKLRDELALRLKAFFDLSARYRLLARVRTAREMIGLLLADGLEAEILSKEEGELRLRRVLHLAESASGSVNAFLLALKAGENQVKFCEGGGENAVKVLTMHASKGLEYPVVILVDMNYNFRAVKPQDELFYSDDFSFAAKGLDRETRTCVGTLHRTLITQEAAEEERKSELNLLYVAMTRAKERLYLVFQKRPEEKAPDKVKSFADFIPAPFFEEHAAPLPMGASGREEPPLLPAAEEEGELVAVYGLSDPHAESAELPVKSTASELVQRLRGVTEETFSSGGRGHSAAEGTAYHAFLQYADLGGEAGVELARMRKEGLLSEEQLAVLDADKLNAILSLPVLRGLKGRRVLREQTFLVQLSAREAGLADTDDRIVFQGAVDLLAETEEGWLLVDYKLSSHPDEQLRRDYAPQIALYKKAVAAAMHVSEHTVRACILNIALGREVDMDK